MELVKKIPIGETESAETDRNLGGISDAAKEKASWGKRSQKKVGKKKDGPFKR